MTDLSHIFPIPAPRDFDPQGLRMPLFSVTGARAGPRLVVTGPEKLVRVLAERFWDRPELVRMRGAMVMRANTQDPIFDLPDDVLALTEPVLAERRAYFRVLGRMTALGMIQGRSVPPRWVN